jgi:3-hydroxy-9,10-secoandrosta-1,3,5(10)-triene-9,17-dione monooxygenase
MTDTKAAPAPALTRAEAVERVREIVPFVRECAGEIESGRRQPQALVDRFVEAGLAKLLVPKRFGGDELPLDVLLDTVIEVGKADASAGWCFSFLVIHGWLTALFPEQVQAEVWRDGPDTCIATSAVPAARLAPADGGFMVSGNSPWVSGVDYAEWVVLAGMTVPAEGTRPRAMWFFVPKSDYRIVDTWFAAGQRGSGSKNVVIENVFVPAYRTVAVDMLREGKGPGTAINTAPMYALPLVTAYPFGMISPIIGATIGAYETWIAQSQKSTTALSRESVASLSHRQIRVAEIQAQIDCAEMLVRRALDMVRDGGEITLDQRVHRRRDFAYAARLCQTAMEQIYTNSGAGAQYDSNPIQRYWRDIHAMTVHAGLNFDSAGENFGRHALGLPLAENQPLY